MIRETAQARAWQSELREAYRNPAELLDALGLDAASVGLSAAAAGTFFTSCNFGRGHITIAISTMFAAAIM